jgi:hypothetical protein
MPRLYQAIEIEKVVAHDTEVARALREEDERLAAAKKVRFDAWRDGKKGELDSLIAQFKAGKIEAGEYTKREQVVEAELGRTVDNFEAVEDDKSSDEDEDEIESVSDVEIFGARSSKTGKVAAMSAKKVTTTKKTKAAKKSELSMDGWTKAVASKVVRSISLSLSLFSF